jgi:hypothetical protein
MKACEQTPIGHSPLQQLLSRAHGFRVRQIEGADPLRMFELRRMNQRVAHVEQLLPSRRNQHGGVSRCVAGRRKDQYARRDFRRAVEQAQAVPGGRYVIPNGSRHHNL